MLETTIDNSPRPFKERFNHLKNTADLYIQNYVHDLKRRCSDQGLSSLVDAMAYSLIPGGSRFRPALCMLVAECLQKPQSAVLPLAGAIELIHCYSLIHDDLPSMDNDDFRRGRPSNHKVYGEAISILAGDALSTEAFLMLAKGYSHNSGLALRLIEKLSELSGPTGLAGGQAMDLNLKNTKPDLDMLENLHSKKTGRLFEACVVGSAIACEAKPAELEIFDGFSKILGLVFQITDDILDGENTVEPSFVNSMGLEVSKLKCQDLIEQGQRIMKPFGGRAQGLIELLNFIFERTKSR